MANRKKVKEETTSKSKPANVTSNIEENKEGNPQVETPSAEDLREETCESLEQELKEAAELEELSQSQNDQVNDQEGIPDSEEQVVDSELKEEKPKLHVLADDRLNSLINTANELGITDVVQIINSEKYGQFYLVYRE